MTFPLLAASWITGTRAWVVGLCGLLGAAALAVSAPAAPLRIGVTAYRPSAIVQAEFQPVAEALSNALGRPVELRVLPPLVLADAYAEGRIDLLFGGSQLQTPLQRRLPLPAPIATLRRSFRGEPLGLLAGTLLIRADAAPLEDLSRLPEYRLAVAESLAPEGSEELARQLAVRGLPPIPANRLVWTPDHDTAIQWLLEGRTELALVRTGLLEALVGSGTIADGQLQVVAARQSAELPLAHSTLPVPEWSVLPSPRMDAAQRRQLAIILLRLELPATATAPDAQPIVGFDPPADYTLARLPVAGPTPGTGASSPIGASLLILLLPLSALAFLYRRRSRALFAAETRSRHLRQLLDALPVGVWHRDRHGQLREVNARVRQVLAVDAAKLEHLPDYAALFPEEIATQLDQAEAETLATGSVRHRRIRLATPDGQFRELELVQVRSIDAQGRVDGVCSVAIERSAELPIDAASLLTEYEQVLGRSSTDLVSADTESVDAAIRRALAAVGAACLADRAYLFLFSADGRRADNTHEWCAAGVEPQIASLQDLAMAQDLPWLFDALQRRETLAVEDVARLPAAAAAEQRLLMLQGIRSFLMLPMLAGNRLVGFIGLDDVRGRRRWQPGEQSLLRVVGEMLVHALLRLRAERNHSESVSRLQAVLGALPDLLFVFDADGHYLDVHARDHGKLTRDGRGLIGLGIHDTLPPAVAARTEAALRRIFGGSPLERFDYSLNIDGRELSFAAELVPLDAGRVLAICRDITERRQTEQALAASESRYRALVDHSQSLIFQLDGEHRLQFLSRSTQLLLGQLPSQLIGRKLTELIASDDLPRLVTYLARLCSTGGNSDPALDDGIELRFPLADGRLRWLHVVMTPVAGADAGAPIGLVGNAVDITGRVEARELLSALATQLQAVIDGVPSLIFAKDAEGRFVLANRACAACFGRTPAQLIGLSDAELMPDEPELTRAYRQADLQAAGSDTPILVEREPIRQLDGALRWFQTLKTRWVIPGDPRPGVLGIATDISARIDAETRLRHESELTALLVRIALTYIDLPAERLPDTIRQSVQELATFVGADRGYLFRLDAATRNLSNTVEWCAEGVTPQIDRLQNIPIDRFGELVAAHTRGAVIEVADIGQLADPATREYLAAQDIRSLLSIPLMQGEACIGFVGFDWVRDAHRCTTGEIQLLTVFAQMLVNAQVHAATAEALEQQRRRLELIVEGAAAGTWIWWPQTGALEINERWAAMLGYRVAELAPVDFETWRRLSHPDNLAVAEAALAAHAAGETPTYEARLRMRHKDGHWIRVLTRGRIVQRDERGKVLVYAGTHQDITAQVAAEERLQLAASVFTHSHEGILITDADARILEVNEAFTRITGYPRAEVIGRNPRLLSSGRHGPEFYRELWDSLGQHGHWAGEIWNRRRNGECYAQFLTISVVRDSAGKVLNHVALFSDITAQKQRQQRLDSPDHAHQPEGDAQSTDGKLPATPLRDG